MENPKDIELRRRAAEERIRNLVSLRIRREAFRTQKRENDANLKSSVAAGALCHD